MSAVAMQPGLRMDETGRIELLARLLGGEAPGVEVGIGDDAAVLLPPAPTAKLVWTVDEQVEGTHFRRDWLSWGDVGWRSFAAAASDLAAMGARPWCALAALVLPDDVDDEAFEHIVRGQREASQRVGAPIVGGNLARGPAMSAATTLLGVCPRAITRAGAQPGDGVWMAGRVGLARAGLEALRTGRAVSAAHAVEAWRRPRPLIDEGMAMAPRAHAAVDVSDGLARDAGHIATSSGVQVVLDAVALAGDAPLAAACHALGAEPLDFALYGGEDYALVAASREAIEGFRRIGEIRAGAGVALREGERVRPLEDRGFDHFAAGGPPRR